jgi:protein AbiQ
MILNLKLVRVNSDYCDYLRKFDYRVSYNKAEKKLRPFIGILFKINKIEYFAPLSSPKKKHLRMKNKIDFYKLDNGKLGAVNFNNMIPVNPDNYEIIHLRNEKLTVSEKKYQELLIDQLTWLNEHYYQVKSKSFKLYNMYVKGKLSKNINDRCCNFKLLEEKSKEYKTNIEKVN